MEVQKDQILAFWNLIQVTTLTNQYALENIAFGKLRPKDQIPFDRFVEELELQKCDPYAYRDCIEGIAITKEETVPDEDIEIFLKECFVSRMNFVFKSAPKKGSDYDDDGLHCYLNGLNEYIMQLYLLFKEILHTEVTPDFFESGRLFPDRPTETACYEKIAKFVVSIKTRLLRQGGCVDRYVKNLPYLPVYVKRLLKIHKSRYLLANSDTSSLDYKLAVLSAMQFMNPEHTKLFELKAIEWEKSLQ